MKKIFFRVLGYVLCAVLMVLCILLIITSSLFGARKTVDIFGSNVYIVETDDISSAPKGSAVFVKKGSAAGLEEGKLVLYLKSDANDEPTLGYVKDISARDGVAYITVAYKDEPYEFPESKLVGRADYASKFWGGLIRFVKMPLGVMVIAVLPCAALILFDIARAAAANRPEPEVVPKVKNADEEPPHTDVKLSVDTEGKASYAKDRSLKPLPKNNDVLFSYSGRQKDVKKDIPRNERPIIPLTDKKPSHSINEDTEFHKKSIDIKIPSKALDSAETASVKSAPVASKKPNPAAIRPEPKTPVSVAQGRYSQNSERALNGKASEKTAELPIITPKNVDSDAFFAQPSAGRKIAPQIGRQRVSQIPSDDELPTAHAVHTRPEKTAGKRSTQILASKGLDDLFSDEDDERSSSSRRIGDTAVDDILAGLERDKL